LYEGLRKLGRSANLAIVHFIQFFIPVLKEIQGDIKLSSLVQVFHYTLSNSSSFASQIFPSAKEGMLEGNLKVIQHSSSNANVELNHTHSLCKITTYQNIKVIEIYYGTNSEVDSVLTWYENYFTSNGWQIANKETSQDEAI